MVNEYTILKDNINNVKILLREFASRNSVADAINGRDIVTIYYDSPLDTTNNRGYRVIEPYVLGISKSGNLVVRAYQQSGASDSNDSDDPIPGWRLFRLDGIKVIYKTLKKFDTTPEFIQQNRPKYNPKDKDMTQILVSVDPTVQPNQSIDGNKSIDQPDIIATKSNNLTSPSVFKNQTDKLRSFYSKPIPKLDNGWYDNIKNKFLSDLNKLK